MEFKGILFDFDYTLGDATQSIVAGFTHGFTQMGHEVPHEDTVKATVGMMLEDAYTFITGETDVDKQKEFRRYFVEVGHAMQMEQGVPLLPNAKELLLALKEAGIPAGIVSSKRTDAIEAIMAHHGLSDTLSVVIGGDAVSNPKPDPEGLLMAAERFGLKPDEILYCGDTMIDAEAARLAKMRFCPVINGVTPPEAFATFPWVHVAENLTALQDYLGL